MKPRHAVEVKISRCPCCQSHASKNLSSKKRKSGNTIGRRYDKKMIKESADS